MLPGSRRSGRPDPRRVMLHLLRSLRDGGPMSADEVARLCLTPRQVMSVMAEGEQRAHAERTVQGLIDLLEEQGTEATLVVALRRWRMGEAEARAALDWDDLPAVVRKGALALARHTVDRAERQGWIEPFELEGHPRWRITPIGGGAIDQLVDALDR